MSFGLLWSLLVKDPLIIISTIIFGSVSVCVSFFDPRGTATDRIARAWAALLLRIAGVEVHIHGLEYVEPGRSYTFVGNHLSLYDTPVVLARVPNRFLFLVSSRYVKLPFLGTHLRRTGHFSVDPEDIRGSLKIMSEAARAMRKRNVSVLLFPEGTRARGEMGEFKEGAAYMAIKAGVPVIPFSISGTREVLPVGSVHVRGGRVDLTFGPPIATESFTIKDRAELNAMMRARVADLLSG